MMAGAILALIGMGVLFAGLLTDGDVADDLPPSDNDEEAPVETGSRVVSLLGGTELAEADNTQGEVFAASAARDAGGSAPSIRGFDPENDLVAFNLSELTDNCVSQDGSAHFPDPATVAYDLAIAPQDSGETMVTLTLFDSANVDTEPVCYDVCLEGVSALEANNVAVVEGDVDLETVEGGERAAFQIGTDGADVLTATAGHTRIETGGGADLVTGTLSDAQLDAGSGADIVDADATNSTVAGGDGNDVISVTGGAGNGVDGGAGNDVLNVELGTDVSGGSGADTVNISVPNDPAQALPLFLWNQPVEDARFSDHSMITLEDAFDTVQLTLDPNVGGHLHQVHISQESFGTSSSEVFTHTYTLVIWSPEGVTDIADHVTGTTSAFNGSLAQDSERGMPDYESAATNPSAPRVLLTINHGTNFSGWEDHTSGDVSGGYRGQHDLHLVTNREMTSIHHTEIY